MEAADFENKPAPPAQAWLFVVQRWRVHSHLNQWAEDATTIEPRTNQRW